MEGSRSGAPDQAMPRARLDSKQGPRRLNLQLRNKSNPRVSLLLGLSCQQPEAGDSLVPGATTAKLIISIKLAGFDRLGSVQQ